jgi:hypothetical protein
MVAKLRWSLDNEVLQAQGFDGVVYLALRDGERGYIAGLRLLEGRYQSPQIQPLGTASTVQQARWLCEQHHS